jgi:hypothetical protein
MRKRGKQQPRPSADTELSPTVEATVPSSDKSYERSSDGVKTEDFILKLLSGVLVPVIVSAVTLLAAAWQFNVANERTERARFLDGALVTAQETSVLLGEGYNALEKLLNATDSQGWKAFSEGAFRDYMKFHRDWRQRAISQHFKLARYFGRDLADQIIHIDEVDLRPVDNLGSPNPCSPPGTKADFDIEKMSFQTWCTITRIPLLQDAIDDRRTAQAGMEFFELIQAKREREDFARELLTRYDKVMVGYLRELNKRLTQLGQPQVAVLYQPTGAGAGRP